MPSWLLGDPAVAVQYDHQHGVRILARAWTRVIYRCWTDGVPYAPERRGNVTTLCQRTAA
jgi:hypothetical protein